MAAARSSEKTKAAFSFSRSRVFVMLWQMQGASGCGIGELVDNEKAEHHQKASNQLLLVISSVASHLFLRCGFGSVTLLLYKTSRMLGNDDGKSTQSVLALHVCTVWLLTEEVVVEAGMVHELSMAPS